MSKAIINALALSLASISSAGEISERCIFVDERDGTVVAMLLKFMLKFMVAADQRGKEIKLARRQAG